MTNTVPMKNNLNMQNSISQIQQNKSLSYNVGEKSFNTKYDTTDERIIERDVAKPLIMLSAYLITAAIIKPPNACQITRSLIESMQMFSLT